jgi:hypothetical protein
MLCWMRNVQGYAQRELLWVWRPNCEASTPMDCLDRLQDAVQLGPHHKPSDPQGCDDNSLGTTSILHFILMHAHMRPVPGAALHPIKHTH